MSKPEKSSDAVPKFLAVRLATLALGQRGTISDYDQATAFLSVGVEMARLAMGAESAAVWLRSVADEIDVLDAAEIRH